MLAAELANRENESDPDPL